MYACVYVCIYECAYTVHVQFMYCVLTFTYAHLCSDKVDKDLIDVLKDFSKAGGYRTWTKVHLKPTNPMHTYITKLPVSWQHLESLVTCTDSLTTTSKTTPLSPVLVEAQLSLARGWKSLLVVGSMDHVSVAMGVVGEGV